MSILRAQQEAFLVPAGRSFTHKNVSVVNGQLMYPTQLTQMEQGN